MKKLTLVACCALALSACSTEYLISKSDGSIISASSKPKLDASSGMYEFKDSDGRIQRIPTNDVKSVIER